MAPGEHPGGHASGGWRRVRRAAGLVHGIDVVVAGVLLALCAWLYYITTTFEAVAPLFAQDVPPEFLPRLLLWTIVILSVLLPFEHLVKPQGRAHLDTGRSRPVKPMAYLTAGLLVVIVSSVPRGGTYIAIVLVCLLLPLLWGERRWRLLLPYALVFPTLVMLLFSRVLKVYFEPGVFGISLR